MKLTLLILLISSSLSAKVFASQHSRCAELIHQVALQAEYYGRNQGKKEILRELRHFAEWAGPEFEAVQIWESSLKKKAVDSFNTAVRSCR